MAIVGKWFGFARQEIFEEALRAYERGDDEGTIDALEEFLQHHPASEAERTATFYLANSYARLAQSYSDAGMLTGALPLLQRAIALAPGYPDLHLQAARLYRQLGRSDDEAIEAARALELNPNYREGILYEAARRQWAGDRTAALALLEEHGIMCEGILRCDGEEGAREIEKLAQPADAGTLMRLRLASLYLREHLYSEAAAEYEAVLANHSGYADVHFHYAEALLGLGRHAEGCHQLGQALSINPHYGQARALMSRCQDLMQQRAS